MNTATTFTSPTGSQIRVVDIKGEPWFVAADVLFALDYPLRSHGQIIKKLGADESSLHRIQSDRRSQRIVSESGLYKLVLRSDKAQAKAFQDWVTRDVLPAIRKAAVANAFAGLSKVRFPMAPDHPPEPSGEPPDVTEMRRRMGL